MTSFQSYFESKVICRVMYLGAYGIGQKNLKVITTARENVISWFVIPVFYCTSYYMSTTKYVILEKEGRERGEREESEKDREREIIREWESERHRQRERETERDTQRERERERERQPRATERDIEWSRDSRERQRQRKRMSEWLREWVRKTSHFGKTVWNSKTACRTVPSRLASQAYS